MKAEVTTGRSSERLFPAILPTAIPDCRTGPGSACEFEVASVIDPRYRVLVWFLVLTGVRFGEAVALQTTDLDTLRRTITVSKTATEVRGRIIHGPPKTAAGRRRIALPESLVEDLAQDLANRSVETGLLSPAPKGGYLRRTAWRKRVWIPAIKAAGIEGLPVHDLRHTAVAWLIAADEHPAAISHRLGHAPVATILDRYGHLLPGLDAGAAIALDRLREAAAPPPAATDVVGLPPDGTTTLSFASCVRVAFAANATSDLTVWEVSEWRLSPGKVKVRL